MMEVICQQFLISCNKNQKVQRLTISWYQGNVGPVDPQQSGFWGNVEPYRKGTINVCCDTAVITSIVKR